MTCAVFLLIMSLCYLKSSSGHLKRKVYCKSICGLKLITKKKNLIARVKLLFVDNMNVYPKNLRKSRGKLLEIIMENLSKMTATENGLQKL